MTHRFALRVYYEDIDLGGIVYYANYLKFIERARSEWVRALGIDQRAMRAEGRVFAVARLSADYLRPAVFDDQLEVVSVPARIGGASLVLTQDIWRGGVRLFAARVTLVCLGPSGTPTRLPAALRQVALCPPHAHVLDLPLEPE